MALTLTELESVVTDSLRDMRTYVGDENVTIFAASQNGTLLSWLDNDTNEYHTANELNASNFTFERRRLQSCFFLEDADWTGAIFYGQSWSIGVKGAPVLTSDQPFHALTFGGGPKAGKPGNAYGATNTDPGTTTTKALVEDTVSGDGNGETGESPGSGFAEYLTQAMVEHDGAAASDNVPFVSAPGHGGYSITELDKGGLATDWYNAFLDHVAEARARATAAGKKYRLHVVAWLQGETDAGAGMSQATYAGHFDTLINNLIADGKTQAGQNSQVHILTYQTWARVATAPGPALAQLAACEARAPYVVPHVHFVTPAYHLPIASGDTLHLSNIGYKRLGAYFGRAYRQLRAGFKPDCIRPIGAILRGEDLTVTFRTPRPLVIDTINLAEAQNHGFRVKGDSATIAPADIQAQGNKVTMTIAGGAAALGANPVVRYALDYLGTGLTMVNGALGNLRDSTTDTYKIGSTIYPMWHVTPHFQLPISIES